jgi:hypothetical protein
MPAPVPTVPAATLQALASSLRGRRGEIAALGAVAGLDGFVDEMISVVGERRGVGDWTPLASMAELGRIVAGAAGHNSLREIVVRSADPGGCAVNLADGLIRLGVPLDFLGTLGTPRHPSFDAFAASCRTCTALGRSYGRTLAFEFGDGKFMFSAVSQLAEIDPGLLRAALADGAFAAACRRAQLIALTNWTLYPHMTACWRLLQREVFAGLGRRPWLFIDLVDPSSRAEADVRGMLAALGEFQLACDTVLGVNFNEAAVLGRILGLGTLGKEPEALRARAGDLRFKLGLSQVVIHNARLNAVADASGSTVAAAGPFCAKPVKTTGAGDRFNAGYCLGLMLGLAPFARLALGSATSGFFVRHARSADLDDLAVFLASWADGGLA